MTKSGVSERGRSMHADVKFKLKRQTSKTSTETFDNMYGQVNLSFDDSADIDPISVFEKVSDLGTLV